jgi:hypothetical protein
MIYRLRYVLRERYIIIPVENSQSAIGFIVFHVFPQVVI